MNSRCFFFVLRRKDHILLAERGPYLGLPYYHATKNESPEIAREHALQRIVLRLTSMESIQMERLATIKECEFNGMQVEALIYEVLPESAFEAPMCAEVNWHHLFTQEKPLDMFARAVQVLSRIGAEAQTSSVCAA